MNNKVIKNNLSFLFGIAGTLFVYSVLSEIIRSYFGETSQNAMGLIIGFILIWISSYIAS
jgi:hypothetical protein